MRNLPAPSELPQPPAFQSREKSGGNADPKNTPDHSPQEAVQHCTVGFTQLSLPNIADVKLMIKEDA